MWCESDPTPGTAHERVHVPRGRRDRWGSAATCGGVQISLLLEVAHRVGIVRPKSAWPNFLELVRLPAGSAVHVGLDDASRPGARAPFRDATMSPKALLLTIYSIALPGVKSRMRPSSLSHPSGRHTKRWFTNVRPACSTIGPAEGGNGGRGGKRNARIGAQTRYRLAISIARRQNLLGLDRRAVRRLPRADSPPRNRIPATHPTVERIAGRPESEIRATRPVGRVMFESGGVACGIETS